MEYCCTDNKRPRKLPKLCWQCRFIKNTSSKYRELTIEQLKEELEKKSKLLNFKFERQATSRVYMIIRLDVIDDFYNRYGPKTSAC